MVDKKAGMHVMKNLERELREVEGGFVNNEPAVKDIYFIVWR